MKLFPGVWGLTARCIVDPEPKLTRASTLQSTSVNQYSSKYQPPSALRCEWPYHGKSKNLREKKVEEVKYNWSLGVIAEKERGGRVGPERLDLRYVSVTIKMDCWPSFPFHGRFYYSEGRGNFLFSFSLPLLIHDAMWRSIPRGGGPGLVGTWFLFRF